MAPEPVHADARERTLATDWLGVSRRSAQALREILHANPTTLERARETGSQGEGGDRTLVIDEAAEAAVFAELDALHAAGARFTAISEERGEVDYGDRGVRVVIDPLDGSVNAKRGLPHHCISIAVAEGDTMGDVFFGFVHDFGPDEEWVARRGAGAHRDGVRLPTDVPERCSPDGKLEVLGLESADPRWIRAVADDLADAAYRVRALGAIAVTLCQVAAARMDAMITIKGCRSVDAAAGQLIVREAGGAVAFIGFDDPLAAPLDLEPHSPLVAARTPSGVEALRGIPQPRSSPSA
jgi:myo-inositol-1(or 4)-monophosphatase